MPYSCRKSGDGWRVWNKKKKKYLPGSSDSKKVCKDRIQAIGVHTHSKPISKAGENQIIKKAFLTGDKENGEKKK